MALDNFFKINFPYGIKSNSKGEWTAFNREHKPLGYTDSLKEIPEKDFIYCKYKNLTETILNKLGDTNGGVEKKNNKIVKVFFYNCSTNPSNSTSKELYYYRLKKLVIYN